MSKEEIIQKQFENTMQDEQIDQMKTMLANMEFKLHSEINEKNFELQSMKSEILNTEIRDLQLKQIADEQDEEIRRLIEILSSLNDKTGNSLQLIYSYFLPILKLNSKANLKVKLQHQISANDKMEDEIVDMEHQIEYTEIEIDNKNERLTKARHELLEQKLINEERRKGKIIIG